MIQSLVVGVVMVCVCAWFLGRKRSQGLGPDPIGLSMIGAVGLANENISSRGSVFIRGELWNAACERGIILRGEAVRVVAVQEELTLLVERLIQDSSGG